MSNERIRFSELYPGQQATVFCVPNEFDYAPERLRFNFDCWSSVESFEAGQPPINRLRQEFTIDGERLEEIKTGNAALFSGLDEITLSLLRVGGRGYSIRRAFLTAVGKFMILAAESPSGEHKPTDEIYGSEYDAIIAEHNQTIMGIAVFMIAEGKKADEFLRSMEIISPQMASLIN